MKILDKFGFLMLWVVLMVITFFNYLDYKNLLLFIEQEGLLIHILFDGWIVSFSFLSIALLELLVKNKHFKFFIRILLVLLFFGIVLKNFNPIKNYDYMIENTAIFSGMMALLILLVLGIKKLLFLIFKLAGSRSLTAGQKSK